MHCHCIDGHNAVSVLSQCILGVKLLAKQMGAYDLSPCGVVKVCISVHVCGQFNQCYSFVFGSFLTMYKGQSILCQRSIT